MTVMQSIVALLGARTHARFILPVARHRRLLLGLRGTAAMQATGALGSRPGGTRPTVRALRATRTYVPVGRPSRGLAPLRREPRMSWQGTETAGARATRTAIAAPWRG